MTPNRPSKALLNDGSAVVIFQIFLEVAAGRSAFKFWEALQKLIRMVVVVTAAPITAAAAAITVIGLTVQASQRLTVSAGKSLYPTDSQSDA